MKTLLRTYLIVIFASSALNTGHENDSVNVRTGFGTEASSSAGRLSYPQNLEGIAECMSPERPKANNVIRRVSEEDYSVKRNVD